MKRYILLTGLALIIFGAMFYVVESLARDRAFADADRELVVRAQFFANALDRVLQQRMMQTFTYAALPSLRGFAASDETTRARRSPEPNSPRWPRRTRIFMPRRLWTRAASSL